MIKKILPYIFIVLVMIGFFSPASSVYALTAGYCTGNIVDPENYTDRTSCQNAGGRWIGDDGINVEPKPTTETKNNFGDAIGCAGTILGWSLEACLTKILYFLFFTLPSGILVVVAKLFDVTLALTLSTFLLENNYLSEAWRIVRDFSNIFFILVLLYISFELILGLGGHGAQKMIIKVIIVALLINFSMLATKIVIDTSNVLALIFYNKITVITKDGDITVPQQPTINEDLVGVKQKDFSTAIAASFDPTQFIDFEKFNETKTGGWMGTILTNFVPGGIVTGPVIERVFLSSIGLPTSMAILLIAISCVMFLMAAYAFFMASIAFMGRLIEFWILIVFSPFAFMSITLPKLESFEYIGWKDWSTRLFSVAFMAPIFMFFMLIISKLIQIDPFGRITDSQSVFTEGGTKSFAGIIILAILPAIINIGLLLKAIQFAKKGGGQFGEMITKYGTLAAGAIGGLALGAATGGAGLLATNTVGKYALGKAASQTLQAKAASGDKFAQAKLSVANSFANKSFDLRETKLGKYTAKKAGLNLNNAGVSLLGLDTEKLKGGRVAQIKKTAEAEQKKMKSYYMTGASAAEQDKRHDEYKKDKEKASEAYGGFLEAEEKAFEEAYKKGDTAKLRELGLSRDRGEIRKGDIENSKAINKARKKAYIQSLKEGEKIGSIIMEGIGKMVTTKGGLATTAAVGATAGIVGAGAVIPIGGFLYAVKEVVAGGVRKSNPEVLAMLQKGVKDEKEEWIEHGKHLFGHQHEEGGDHGSDKAAAHPPTPATAPAVGKAAPASGGHGAAPAAHH